MRPGPGGPGSLPTRGAHRPVRARINPTRNDARYPSEVIVHYPLHPFFGRGKLPVVRRYGIGNVEHVEVQVNDVCHAVPVWMTDERFCGRMTIGFDPFCSLTALLQLLSLLGSAEL